MTQQGAKKWAKEIEALQNGKTIQYRINKDWIDIETPNFDECGNYRIKPEPKLVPFDLTDAEKLIGKVVKNNTTSKLIEMVVAVNEHSVICQSGMWYYTRFLKDFTFIDGSPCGKEEQE